ncbi:TraB/GumN family protein [Brevundimonas sp. Root1423]|uniref:TraB/GumN family protein n=1 Tax=Brevundimonas sp. Root1423 TaxID=1736462 RepID=UPI0006F2579D|nr:TraB/GumN family protein [Brevundimonas sp. Root1423]KQY85880.1 polysaccharide biosynthesis protein GumN [Brevundimonas sp. Root1423]
MTVSTFRTQAGHMARTALGAVLGLSLAGAVIFQPVQAFAQATAAAATPVPAARVVARAEGAGPALWAIRDADSTIYLFGTVHVLRPTTAWGSARVDAAFASADDVWFEVSNPDDQAAIVPVIQQYGVSPDRPLSSLLTAEELTDLNAAAAAAGLTAAQIDPFRPWLAAVTLSLAPMVKAGYDPQSGVERILKARADAAGTPVHGFETLDKQIGIIAGMSEADQLDFLRATLEAYDEATTELDAMVNTWAAGDLDAFEKISVDEMRDEAPAVYQALLVQRNTDWAGQIQTLLAGSGTAFIAVGAAHLAGDDSVQEILADRGVAVTREE